MRCRTCEANFSSSASLEFSDMPKAAQQLPSSPYDSGVHLGVYECPYCSLVQLDGVPVPYYKEVIRSSGFSEEMRIFREKQLNDFILKYKLKDKEVIEIGCGGGEYLEIIKKSIPSAWGIDNKISERDKPPHLVKGYVDSPHYRITNSDFDAFFCFNFMEHWPNPNLTLKGIHNNLTDGAVGLVEVPNLDMMIEKELFTEFIQDHLSYYTEETLRTTLERNGFEVLECKPIWYNYILSAVVKKRKRADFSHFHERKLKISEEVNSFIDSHNKVVVWGAGHQSFAALALFDIKHRISYVVDSAPFKQGKYTPATGLYIDSPEILYEDSMVDAIIVMAASYSDGVVEKITTKFKNISNIAVLRDWGLEYLL